MYTRLSPSILISQSQQSERTEFPASNLSNNEQEKVEKPERFERFTFPSKIVIWEWLGYEPYRKAVVRGQFYVKDYLVSANISSISGF
jgi:hypothetical protein